MKKIIVTVFLVMLGSVFHVQAAPHSSGPESAAFMMAGGSMPFVLQRAEEYVASKYSHLKIKEKCGCKEWRVWSDGFHLNYTFSEKGDWFSTTVEFILYWNGKFMIKGGKINETGDWTQWLQ